MKKDKSLLIIEKIFWVIYLVLPIFTGILAYNWLPNESPNKDIHIILSSHEECDPYNQCVQIPNAWQNKETGEIYTPSNFGEHNRKEGNKKTLYLLGYLLLGGIFYVLFSKYNEKIKNIEL